MNFVYWDGAVDLFLEEPDLPPAEFFNQVECTGRCTGCGGTSAPVGLEC